MSEKSINIFNDTTINKWYVLFAQFSIAFAAVWTMMFFFFRESIASEVSIVTDVLLVFTCIIFLRVDWLYKNKKEKLK